MLLILQSMYRLIDLYTNFIKQILALLPIFRALKALANLTVSHKCHKLKFCGLQTLPRKIYLLIKHPGGSPWRLIAWANWMRIHCFLSLVPECWIQLRSNATRTQICFLLLEHIRFGMVPSPLGAGCSGREIATFHDVLRSQVDVMLCDRMNNFFTNELQDIKVLSNVVTTKSIPQQLFKAENPP